VRIIQASSPQAQNLLKQRDEMRLQWMDDYDLEIQKDFRRYRQEGEDFLVECAKDRDGLSLNGETLWVDPAQIKTSGKLLSIEARGFVESVKDRIERYQSELKLNSFTVEEEAGVLWGVEMRSFDRVGIYTPGGRVSYFMSLLIHAVPARMAGVKEIVVATPPKDLENGARIDPLMLYAAKLLEIDRILLAGGAPAMAALAFGTARTQPVQKIVGSGSNRTNVAKMRLAGIVSVDTFAGPSETAFVCDKSADPRVVAADILGRADHDPSSLIYVLHQDEEWIQRLLNGMAVTLNEVKDQQTQESIRLCLEKNFVCLMVKNIDEALKWVNQLAPATLCLHVKNPSDHIKKVQACGLLLLGPFTPPTAVDLFGGASGALATSGAAKFFQFISPASFQRRFSYVEVDQSALERTQESSRELARLEGFVVHDESFKTRLE
jgi:histidinol dehydrogenase